MGLMNRRDFIKVTGISAAGLAAADFWTAAADDEETNSRSAAGVMKKRPFGPHEESLSIIGLGGLVVAKLEQAAANRLVAEVVEKGVNYFDVAPTYGDAELKLGPALKPYRKDVFLACKTTQRQADGAAFELERSLQRLETDYFDLYQLHGIQNVPNDVEAAFSATGAMKILLEAKKAGKIKHLGFSAHSRQAALAAMDYYDFDSVLFPVNFACWYKGDIGPEIMAKAEQKKVARLALKALAKQRWPENAPERQKYSSCWYQPLSDPHEAELGLRWTLSQPVTAAIPPADDSLFRMALDMALNFRPLRESEVSELKRLAADLAPIF